MKLPFLQVFLLLGNLAATSAEKYLLHHDDQLQLVATRARWVLDIFLSCEILFLHFIQSNLLLSYCYRSFSQVRSAVEQYLAVDGVQTHPQGSSLQGTRRRGLVYVTDNIAAVFYCPQSGGCLTLKFDLNASSSSSIHPTSSPSINLRS